jgi:hypothetical protein
MVWINIQHSYLDYTYDVYVETIWTYEKQILHDYYCQIVAQKVYDVFGFSWGFFFPISLATTIMEIFQENC